MKDKPAEKLPLIRISKPDSHAFTVVIPGWNAQALSLAHRIAARISENLNTTENMIYVERGRHGLCTIVRVGMPGGHAPPPSTAVDHLREAIVHAVTTENGGHRMTRITGGPSHRVEVVP